jgi:muramidase (phage lysozyme)
VTRDDLLAALTHDNVVAMLRVIRAGESSQDDSAYSVMFGGGHFNSFADHPRIKNTARGLTSTAAGAYQILERTWNEVSQRYGLEDFTPRNQDCAAVGLIARRKALDDVLAGRFDQAIAKLGDEWASIPGSKYGQPTRTKAQALETYLSYGGRVSDDSPSPDVPDANRREVKPMAPLIIPILSMLADAIPALGKMFGSGSEVAQRNVAAGTLIADKLVEVTKAVNLQEAAEKIQNDPSLATAAQAAVNDVLGIIEAGGGGIDGARKQASTPDGDWHKAFLNPAFVIGLLFTLLAAFVVVTIVWGLGTQTWSDEIKAMVVTAVVSGALGSVSGFFLGSSLGSRNKDAKP